MPYRPMARPRCLIGKASLGKTMAIGVMGPLPMPCNTRKKMSVGPLQAMPQSIELPTKVSKPSRKRLRLPRRLPSQPTVGMSTAPAIMYAVRIHCAWSKLIPKVVIMGGKVTFIADFRGAKCYNNLGWDRAVFAQKIGWLATARLIGLSCPVGSGARGFERRYDGGGA